MKVKANAKINLYLKVLGKNETGYHDLDSLMVPIDLYDYIEIENGDSDEIIGMDIPMKSNLIYKAVELLRNKYNISKSIKIKIEKNIPSFAGLGGGSSDAAATLKALNELWELNITTEELLNLASEIGSDVPFFIINKPAIIGGRGEKITPVEIKSCSGVLIFDNYKFSTKDVFANMKKYSEPYQNIVTIKDGKNVIEDYYSLVTNDMEEGITIYKESTEITKQKDLLLGCGAINASMSGSGSSVFGLFESDKIDSAYSLIKDKYKNVWKFKILL